MKTSRKFYYLKVLKSFFVFKYIVFKQMNHTLLTKLYNTTDMRRAEKC